MCSLSTWFKEWTVRVWSIQSLSTAHTCLSPSFLPSVLSIVELSLQEPAALYPLFLNDDQSIGVPHPVPYPCSSLLLLTATKFSLFSAHMSLVQLEKVNLLHWLVSQNTDGLHRRSGFPVEKFSELHGNSNLERCPKCQHEYLRDFGTRNAREVHDHRTGRMCGKCGTELEDTIINFGESLPAKHIKSGFDAARRAEVCLALGSSLRVTPAANIPAIVGGKPDGKLVIVNLQVSLC